MEANTYQENLYDHPANDPKEANRVFEYKGTRWSLTKGGEAGFLTIKSLDKMADGLPKELEGQWTNPVRAELAITKYVNQAPKKSTPYDIKPKKVKLTPKEI